MDLLRKLVNKNYRDAVLISNRVNKLLKDETFLQELINVSGLANSAYEISKIIEYYIVSDDKNTNYTFSELKDIIDNFSYDNFDYSKYMENLILAHAANGYTKSNIKKNGFTNNDFDKELGEKIEYVESFLGKSTYFANQGPKQENSENFNYMFFTLPGSLSVEYSMKISPERLHMGILFQDSPELLPYKVGEGRKSYFKRVVDSKLAYLSLENDLDLKNSCYEIIEKLCSNDSLLVLFPAKSKIGGKEYEVKAWCNSVGNGEVSSISDFLISPNPIFVEGSASFVNGGEYSENAGNLVTTNLDVNKNDIGIIDIPDYFKCLDISAKSNGFNVGDEIDIITCAKPKLRFDNMQEVSLGGTGRMFNINLYGRSYLYKPAEKKYTHEVEKFRGIVQWCASEVQKIVDSNSAISCYYVEQEDLCGSLQTRIAVDASAPNYYQIQRTDDYNFSEKEVNQFMREFLVDYLLCNFDSHGNNFIVDRSGIIRGIDKEQSFKFINNSDYDFFDINCNPNQNYGEQQSIYNYLFKRYIDKTVDIDFAVFDKYISRVEMMKDEDYAKIFKRYCDSLEEELNVSSEELLNKIVNRKKFLRTRVNDFVLELSKMRNKDVILDEDVSEEINDFMVDDTIRIR